MLTVKLFNFDSNVHLSSKHFSRPLKKLKTSVLSSNLFLSMS